MKRTGARTLLVLGALALSGAMVTSRAEAQGATAAEAPGSAKLAGTWEGPYTTDGPSGTMTIKVSQAGGAWKVENLLGGDAPPPAAPTDIKATGNVITWKQVFGEYDVAFKATLSEDGNQITGTLEATQGGAYVGGGSFTLTKKA